MSFIHANASMVSTLHVTLRNISIGSKVTKIVTTNASNMIHAFSLPGFRATVTNSVAGIDNSDSDDLDSKSKKHKQTLSWPCKVIIKKIT